MTEDQMAKTSKILKYIGGVFLTIFLGAIGSGLWERFLSPSYEYLTNHFLKFLTYIFHGYIDIIHRNIGKAQIDQFSMLPYIVIVVSIILLPWGLVILQIKMLNKNHGSVSKTKDVDINKRIKRSLIKSAFLAVLITLLYGSSLLEDAYTRKACIFVERSIEILAPVIPPERVLEFRAKYRSIDNAIKFYALEDELKSAAKDSKVTLPEFKDIR